MMNFIQSLFFYIICPFIGTVAFAALFCVPRRFFISCGITGLSGWVVYLFVSRYTTAVVATFLGAIVVVLISRILTVRKRCPITVFLVSGIFPLIPGTKVYYTAYNLVSDQLGEAARNGLEAIKIAFAIVFAIVIVVAIPREFFRMEYWRRKRPKSSLGTR